MTYRIDAISHDLESSLRTFVYCKPFQMRLFRTGYNKLTTTTSNDTAGDKIFRASRGPSATAEPVVVDAVKQRRHFVRLLRTLIYR